jgi:FKBP-type peptidyl-prolyl cis-trans isomerase SlyD
MVTLEFQVTVDGEALDDSESESRLQFIQGSGQVLSSLEQGLYGMRVGEVKEIRVDARNGYGDMDPDDFIVLARSEIPAHLHLITGDVLQVEDEQGYPVKVFVVDAEVDKVTLSFNHPLAGKDLTFWVKVINLRRATEEELARDKALF